MKPEDATKASLSQIVVFLTGFVCLFFIKLEIVVNADILQCSGDIYSLTLCRARLTFFPNLYPGKALVNKAC